MAASLIEREVIAGFLAVIADEMHSALIRTAYSLNVKERGDCSCAVLDSKGNTVAVTAEAPLHLGSMLSLVPQLLRRVDESELRPGDVYLANDPYTGGGTHLPDMALVAPVFAEGRIVGYVCNLAHHSDVGGSAPGSMAADSTEIFQEGLRLPVVKLYDEGRRCDDVFDIVLLNSRLPEERAGDLRAQHGAICVGVERLEALCRRYGGDAVLVSMDELMAYSERRIRSKIEAIPDGVYIGSDSLDVDGGEVPLRLRLTVDGAILTFDFSGTGRQVASSKNVPFDALQATVFTVVKQLIDPASPANAGYFRPLRVIAQPGTVVNPAPPAAVSDRAGTCNVVGDVVAGAFSDAMPELAMAGSGPHARLVISGTDERSGRFFVDFETFAGSMGASADRDGMDAVRVFASGMANQPVEASEHAFPIEVLAYELVEDSGGVGRTRGGLSTRRDVRVRGSSLKVSASGERHATPARGLDGGGPGRLPRATVNLGTSEERGLSLSSSNHPIAPGEVVTLVTAAGGGFGDPLERDPELVARDCREGRVSIEQAEAAYGVVLIDGLVDSEATRRRRAGARDRTTTSKR